jgi:hypothetical protein
MAKRDERRKCELTFSQNMTILNAALGENIIELDDDGNGEFQNE